LTNEITYHPSPSRPQLTLPPGACDTHCHVFGPVDRFPYAPEATYRPAEAPKEKLFALHDMLGIERAVIVQSGCHGFDNSVTADAIASRPGRCLGVALLPPVVTDEEIARHDRLGFRAIRFNYMAHLRSGASTDELAALAARLERFGWYLLIHMQADLIEEMAPSLAALPVPVVVDHMGRIDASAGLEQAPFKALMRLLEHEHVWVKVSGAERASRQDPPYRDGVEFARRLVETFPDRVLWGTDWPHPNFRAAPPDDGLLTDLLACIAPSEESRQRLLVENPMTLYRFEK